ncbi:outer membrane lipoprotein carrier protein LolA [Chryseomicrobium sp. FSL W7-1435]|uniref:LolA family protein n=1 Tax=Chryseomicrobium sp. FSL W7-1435 TaxID=2921704 RepID=UPI0031599BC9
MDALKKWQTFVLVLLICLLAGCGAASEEKVKKQLAEKWAQPEGYEVQAEMHVQSPEGAVSYQIEVWHTKPDYYRVSVTDQDPEKNQLIVRNKEGVFVISPHLQKSYQFKSEWPLKHSQAYLIESLFRDIESDKEAQFTEQDKTYTFVTKTKHSHQQQLPKQTIEIDKKSLLPTRVVIHSEDGQEKMELDFKKIELGKIHTAADYEVDPFEKAKDETASAELDDPQFETAYPLAELPGVELVEEQVMETSRGKRVILHYSGEKSFTLVQEPAAPNELLPVFAPGDPAPIDFQLGAMTDYSMQWEDNGVSYFLASTQLTTDEMIEVAASMSAASQK